MDFDDIFKALLLVGYLAYEVVGRYLKHKRSRSARRDVERESPRQVSRADTSDDRSEIAEPIPLPEPAEEPAYADMYLAERLELVERLTKLRADAAALAGGARIERVTNPFAQVLDDHVVGPAGALLAHLSEPTVPLDLAHEEAAAELELILAQVEVFVGQRRDAALRASLGDADTLALSCYRPVMEFADAQGLQLSSAKPVTQLGGYNLAIWVGFIPTGLAPIFLPSDFLDDILWWPAIAHEIGHDFLAATKGVDEGLRRELGLPDEFEGSAALPLGRAQLTGGHLWSLLGGWFEELFCDVFGTLMLGPAYGKAMVRLFASPQDAAAVALVEVARGRGQGYHYDEHPPRHLRVLACAHLLERMGYDHAAAELLDEWLQAHGELPQQLFFPHGGSHVALPIEPLTEVTHELIDLLYDEQFKALAGYRLRSIPGADFGPNLHAQAQRVTSALLAGQLPSTGRVRAVIAGAVVAACAAPERAEQILALARRTIAAEGTFEHAPDAYGTQPPLPAAKPKPQGLREAFILHTILAPRPSARRGGVGRRAGGLLSSPR